MPEIKIKHVVSFSSEDKVHKAENILKSETYRKWKCATPGEKNASIVLQFEKAIQIHSIDIGNESSAFVEILVGRSSDSVKEFQVLLVASSFMSPLESRNETHSNRVRMFGSDKLSQNLREQKWDCVQIVCTQPFNKNITYGLSFIKFHSPPEKHVEQPAEKEVKKTTTKLGAFKLKYIDDEDEDNSMSAVGSWLDRKNQSKNTESNTSNEESPSYAATVLSSSSTLGATTKENSLKRKHDVNEEIEKHPAKKGSTITRVNTEKVGHKGLFGPKMSDAQASSNPTVKDENGLKDMFGLTKHNAQGPSNLNVKPNRGRVLTLNATGKPDKKTPFNQIMKQVVFAISGFVNPLRGDIRDKALEMGAKYKGDWDRTCTHLVCAFVNTPKYLQVRGEGGKIVTKDWIMDCHKKRTKLPWKKYMLGTLSSDSSEEEEDYVDISDDDEEDYVHVSEESDFEAVSEDSESDLEVASRRKKVRRDGGKTKAAVRAKNEVKAVKPVRRKNVIEENSPSPEQISERRTPKKASHQKQNAPVVKVDDSETEDEDAIQDYIADTDVDADSGGDTEDEIMKVEQAQKKAAKQLKVDVNEDSLLDSDDDHSLLPSKADTNNLPLPELPNLFKKKCFHLYGEFSSKKRHDLLRYIMSYNGVMEDYMKENVKYVVTESKWDSNFEEALNENEDLIFVKPEWIFKCHEAEKLVPYQPYIVIPNS